VPWFSYHGGHSGEFCQHAKGTLAAVVQAAFEAGFTHYGLTEHCPRTDPAHLYPEEIPHGVQALSDRFDAYVVQARALQARWADRIELLVGFETEYLGQDPAAEMAAIRQRGFDYIVGSVHDLGGDWIDYSAASTDALAQRLGGREAMHIAYFDTVAEMVETIRPEVVGHLDLIRKFDGPEATIPAGARPAVLRALEAIKAYDGVLDINSGAHRRGLSPIYPLHWILAEARRMDIPVTLGDDSHGGHDVGGGLSEALKAIETAGYTDVAWFSRRSGGLERHLSPLAEVRPRA
jgi:histidinol-phosphatase (PHP family)